MRRTWILVLFLSVCLLPAAQAQQSSGIPPVGKRRTPHHGTLKASPNSTSMARSSLAASGSTTLETIKFYDLTTFPNGTWAQLMDVNDWGVAVGLGDTPAGFDSSLDPQRGYTRPVGVPLIGLRALKWFDLGTFGGESFQNSYQTADTACSAITNTGMIVGLAPTTDDPVTRITKYVRAFAWTHQSGLIDLGALEYLGYYYSNVIGANRLGTVIVGWSGGSDAFSVPALPVAWTPDLRYNNGSLVQHWNIHQLETTGYEQFPYWVADTANNFRQVVGFAFDDNGKQLGFVWNPLPGGGWKILQLPVPRKYRDFTNTAVGGINEKGEIVGNIFTADYSEGLAVLWQPLDPYRLLYKMTVMGTPPGIPDNSSYPASINDLGDIVGTSYDAEGNPLPAYWSTKEPGAGELLDFDGNFGVANKVNNLRTVVGGYWSDTCANGCAAAMQFRVAYSKTQ